MKKYIFTVALLAVIFSAAPLKAADITVGAATWYSWWDFEPEDSPDKFEFDPALLYGPAIALKINNDFTLNSVFLYGEFDGDYKVYFPGPGWQTLPSKTKRYDSDTSLSYRLNDYLKVFGGFKYVGYKFTTDAVPSLSMPAITVENLAYGPAAGLSCVYPLGGSFFIVANGSVMYLRGKSKNSATEDSGAMNYGYNTTASAAYYISSASVTLSLGGRYQYLSLNTDKPNGAESNHKFYGITVSATYSFSL